MGLRQPPAAARARRAPGTILTPFSSALTPIASPGPPGRIASGRLPTCVLLPSTTMRRIQTPAATVETVSGRGYDEGSVTIAPSARKPASTQAVVPSGAPSSPRRRRSGAGARPPAGHPRPRAPVPTRPHRRARTPSCRSSRGRRGVRPAARGSTGCRTASDPGSTGATVSTCAFRISERPPPAPARTPDEVRALGILRDRSGSRARPARSAP